MATEAEHWVPDWAVAPGELLSEALEERHLSQTELARRMDRPLKTVNEIIKGKAALTPATAIQLERALGISAALWTNMESNYRQALARRDDRAQLEGETGFLRDFPIKDLIRFGVLEPTKDETSLLDQLLRFFGVSSPAAWRRQWQTLPALRESEAFRSTPQAVAAWIRWGQASVPQRALGEYDAIRFIGVLREARAWTRQSPFTSVVEKLTESLAAAGVALILLPELAGTHLSGAAYRTDGGVHVIQLSLRHKRDDQFWFSLFHEAGHVANTPQRLFIDVVLPDGEQVDLDADEEAADAFAREMLIPSEDLSTFLAATRSQIDEAGVRSFAREQGVAAGIVVGRLQREGALPQGRLNFLKQKVEFAG
jgi:addiction module HigA family antidote